VIVSTTTPPAVLTTIATWALPPCAPSMRYGRVAVAPRRSSTSESAIAMNGRWPPSKRCSPAAAATGPIAPAGSLAVGLVAPEEALAAALLAESPGSAARKGAAVSAIAKAQAMTAKAAMANRAKRRGRCGAEGASS
jgi:hypothetical protein